MSQDVLNNQEVYDLSQTGDEVQSILNKSEQLPTNPQLQAALDAKQDVIPDLDSIRHNAGLGAQAFQEVDVAEQAAVSAQQSAEAAADSAAVAEAKALQAAGKLDELETFLQGLDPESAASVAAALGLFEQEVEEKYLQKGTYSADTAVGLADNIRGDVYADEQFAVRMTGGEANEVGGIGVVQVLKGAGAAIVQMPSVITRPWKSLTRSPHWSP